MLDLVGFFYSINVLFRSSAPGLIQSVSKARLPLLRLWVEVVGITHSQCSLNATLAPTTARPPRSPTGAQPCRWRRSGAGVLGFQPHA